METKTKEISTQKQIFKQLRRGAMLRVAQYMWVTKSTISMNIKNWKTMKINTAEKILEAIKETEWVEIPLFVFLGKNQ